MMYKLGIFPVTFEYKKVYISWLHYDLPFRPASDAASMHAARLKTRTTASMESLNALVGDLTAIVTTSQVLLLV